MLRYLVLLAIGTAFTTYVTSAQTGKTSNSDDAGRPADKTERISEIAVVPWWDKPEWWSAVAAIGAAGIVGWQSWETRKAATAALKQIEHSAASQRAWLMFSDVKFDRFSEATVTGSQERHSGYMIRLVWLNSGATPAINCAITTTKNIMGTGSVLPKFSRDGLEGQPTCSAPPQGHLFGPVVYILEDELELLRQRTVSLVIYSYATYGTIYHPSTTNSTEVCMEFTHDGLNSDGSINWRVNPTGSQNVSN